jgi:hypothetical protein
MSKSLNLYSIFGYLLPGFFMTALLVIDYDLSKIIRAYSLSMDLSLQAIREMDLTVNYIFNFFSTGTMSDFKIIPFVVFLFFCYLLGHIISAISSLFIEKLVVKQIMGYPSTILITKRNKPIRLKWLFGNYRRSFDSKTIDLITLGVDNTFASALSKDDYYWLCYSYIICKKPHLASRVHHFVNLYGFSRNITAALCIYLFFRPVVLCLLLGSPMDKYSWFCWILFTLIAICMFWNYLKLFRRQAVDIYCLFLSIQTPDVNVETE